MSSKHSSAAIEETDGNLSIPKEEDISTKPEQAVNPHSHPPELLTRTRSKSSSYTSHRLQPPQSLDAALEILTSQSDQGNAQKSITEDWTSTNQGHSSLEDIPATPSRLKNPRDIPPSPSRPVPDTPAPTVGGKAISGPILNHGIHFITDSLLHKSHVIYAAATLQMSPVKNRATGKPLLVEPVIRVSIPNASIATLGSR